MTKYTQIEIALRDENTSVIWVPETPLNIVGNMLPYGNGYAEITRVFTTLPAGKLPSDARVLDPSLEYQISDSVFDTIVPKGALVFFDMDNPDTVYYESKNVICDSLRPVIARLLRNPSELLSGVWGMTIGAGGDTASGWGPTTQPDPTPVQTQPVSEIKRKQWTNFTYLDDASNPTTAITDTIQFLTVFNSTTDNIQEAIREIGLIGGGTTSTQAGGPTNMLSADYWDPTTSNPNSVSLLTYRTIPPFLLPSGIAVGLRWTVSL